MTTKTAHGRRPSRASLFSRIAGLLAPPALFSAACVGVDAAQEDDATEIAPEEGPVGQAESELTATGAQRLSVAAAYGQGTALATGDLDGDGTDDLVIGAPGADQVHVRFGVQGSGVSSSYLAFQPGSDGVPGLVDDSGYNNAHFGDALAVGDFDGDGHADIVVGTPWEDSVVPALPQPAWVRDSGAIRILYGPIGGVPSRPHRKLSRQNSAVPGSPSYQERFGEVLAVGHFNNDSFADLAIGCPSRDHQDEYGSGSVVVLYGGPFGLAGDFSPPSVELTQANAGGLIEEGDGFGESLAVGDFDGLGGDDLAVGASGEDVNGVGDGSGVVSVFFASSSGLTSSGAYTFTGGGSGSQYTPDSYRRFGSALAAGDFNADGRDDIVIGVRHLDVDGKSNAGGVVLMYSGASGPAPSGARLFHANSPRLEAGAVADHHCGRSITVGRFNSDAHTDIAFGCVRPYGGPYFVTSGTFHVMYGPLFTSPYGPMGESWTLDSPGVPGTAGDDQFGYSLAAADFNGDGKDDVACGAPWDSSVTILRGN